MSRPRRQATAVFLPAVIAVGLFASTAISTGAAERRASAARCVPAKKPVRIVLIGSSIAYGVGATPRTSSWAALYSKYLKKQNRRNKLINLAVPGYVSAMELPTGSPEQHAIKIDTRHNITAALAKKPDGLIVSLTGNDATAGIPAEETMSNLRTIVEAATKRHVKVWVSTPTPRPVSASGQLLLTGVRTGVTTTFGRHSLDFWSPITDLNGRLTASLDSGDGAHPNNAGHSLLFNQVVKAKIPKALACHS